MYPGQFAHDRFDDPLFIMATSGETVTYGEYEARCNQLAHLYRDMGLQARDHVSFFMENNPRLLECEGAAERTGLEVELIREAHSLDLLTCPYVFDADQARAMAEVGADVVVPHMGLTTKGTIGAHTARTLDECVELVQAMHDAARAVSPDVLVLCHGGPIAEPEDAAYVLARTSGVVGFFGASSMERLPTEVALTDTMRRFKAIPVTV